MRLTSKNGSYCDDCGSYRDDYCRCDPEIALYEKLKQYEDAEEQGLLVHLPCKVGDVVYRIHAKDHVEKHCVIAFHVSASGLWFWDESGRETPVETIGKTVFLTHEAAEAALKGEKDDV